MSRLSLILPPDIVLKIKGVPIPLYDTDDIPVGGPFFRTFNVKSATWFAHSLPTGEPNWPYAWIWNLNIPRKLHIFMWQICHN